MDREGGCQGVKGFSQISMAKFEDVGRLLILLDIVVGSLIRLRIVIHGGDA